MKRAEIKEAIVTIAAERNATELEIITEMQTGAAIIEDEATLDLLCDIKWDFI